MSHHIRDYLSLVVPFVLVSAAFILALMWGIAVMRGAPAYAHIEAEQQVTEIAPVIPVATEALDAASSGQIDSPLKSALHQASLAVPQNDAPMPRGSGTHTPRIAIIIDDMGLAVQNSARAAAFQVPITLSYLPYAQNIQGQVDAARARGHEIMLHLPMEPLARGLSAGPGALTTRLNTDEFDTRLRANLSAFTGYDGINNHMGSRLTSTPDAIARVMDAIARRDVFFVDSWTSPRSVAYAAAADQGIPRARRDLFLDHDDGAAPVWAALRQAERIARHTGSAVVIGHPKTDTLNVLQAWLPQAIARGVEIVPMSKLVYAGPSSRDPVLLADQGRHRVAKVDDQMIR